MAEEIQGTAPTLSGAEGEDGGGPAGQDEGAVTGVKNNTLEPVLTLNPVFGAEFEHESEYIGEEEDMASDEGLFSHSHLPHSKLTGPLR
jgi:hypothetical protein